MPAEVHGVPPVIEQDPHPKIRHLNLVRDAGCIWFDLGYLTRSLEANYLLAGLTVPTRPDQSQSSVNSSCLHLDRKRLIWRVPAVYTMGADVSLT
jgi:hypothetical protein